MLEDGSRDLAKRAYSAPRADEPRCCLSSRRPDDARCCLAGRGPGDALCYLSGRGPGDARCGLAGLRPDDARLYCCRCAHKRRASPLTCLAICFLVLTYNLLGGFLFLAIEGNVTTEETAVAASKPNLSQSQGISNDLRSKTVERLWSITEDLNILYKENWTKLAAKELLEFQKVLVKTMRGGAEARLHFEHETDYRWTFSTSFLYALTLITTIGHGNVTPKSAAGRLLAVAYACVGIPLVMLYLSALGAALARGGRRLYSRLPHRPAPRADPGDAQPRTPFQAALNLDSFSGGYHWTCRDHTRVPVILSLLLIVLYIALGSFVFHTTERWNLIDGCYFSFASLATIGFGDLKPGLYASTVSAKAEDIAVGVCCIYILVGIVVIAMCFNLIQEDMSSLLRGAAALCVAPSRAVHGAATPGPALAFAGTDKRQQVTFKIDSSNPTKFNSLPRRKSSSYGEQSFQRLAPARRSAGGAAPCVEYFVPRSLSEFNLSGAGELYELAALAPRPAPPPAPAAGGAGGKPRDKMVTFEEDRAAPGGLPADDVFM